MTVAASNPEALRPLLVVAGAALVVGGAMLAYDVRGARGWWIDFSQRQRQSFGRWTGPRYDVQRTIWLGVSDIVLGFVFIVVGLVT